jgi:hypothetical protein
LAKRGQAQKCFTSICMVGRSGASYKSHDTKHSCASDRLWKCIVPLPQGSLLCRPSSFLVMSIFHCYRRPRDLNLPHASRIPPYRRLALLRGTPNSSLVIRGKPGNDAGGDVIRGESGCVDKPGTTPALRFAPMRLKMSQRLESGGFLLVLVAKAAPIFGWAHELGCAIYRLRVSVSSSRYLHLLH